MNFPILTALFALPLIASLILLALPKGAVRAQRGLTGGALLLSLGLALALPFLGDYSAGEDVLRESYPWIPALGITLTLGVDGLSVFLVILSAFLAGIAFVAALAREEAMKFQGSAILLSLFAVFGCFLARDLFLFFLGWEAMLIPTYLFMNRFGGEEGKRAALRFFLYSFAGSAPFLIAFVYRVAEYQALSGNMSFELEALGSVVSPRTTQALLFSAFALAFAVKMPIFPFHTWSPNAYAFAPTPASILLGALLLKVGSYGLLKIAIPLFPAGAQLVGPTLAALAVVGILYGAYAAQAQDDLKKLVAYSSLSHMGFIALGVIAFSSAGITGAVLQMVNHGLIVAGLFLIAHILERRAGTRDLREFGGIARRMPLFSFAFMVIGLAALGLPGTNGFVGEFLILNGAFGAEFGSGLLASYAKPFAVVAVFGVLFGAIYVLRAIGKILFGPADSAEGFAPLDRSERAALWSLVALIFVLGIFPQPVIETIRPAADALGEAIRHQSAIQLADDAPRLTRAAEHLTRR